MWKLQLWWTASAKKCKCATANVTNSICGNCKKGNCKCSQQHLTKQHSSKTANDGRQMLNCKCENGRCGDTKKSKVWKIQLGKSENLLKILERVWPDPTKSRNQASNGGASEVSILVIQIHSVQKAGVGISSWLHITRLKKSISKTKICTDSLLTSLESSRSALYDDVVTRHCTGHWKFTT